VNERQALGPTVVEWQHHILHVNSLKMWCM